MTPDLVLRNPGDVYSLINSGRLRPRRATMVAAVALGSIFLDGWDLGSFGIGTVQISHTFHLDKTADFGFRGISGGYTPAITRVGGIIGAYAFPVLLTAVGQRATIGRDVEEAPPGRTGAGQDTPAPYPAGHG